MWLVGTLVACTPRAGVPDLPITSAALRDFDSSSVDLVVGVVQGDAELVFETPSGVGSLPVTVRGGSVGLALDFTWDPEGHAGDVPIDLTDVDEPTLRDVLGTYRGGAATAAVAFGVSARRMRNGRGASFRESHFALGLAFDAGFEWVVVRPREDDAVHSAVTAGHSATHTGGASDPEDSADPSDSGGGAEGCGCASGPPALPWAAAAALAVAQRRRRVTTSSAAPGRGTTARPG